MAAGLGTRMRSDVPKHLHPILGRRMVDWVLESSTGARRGSDSSSSRRRRRPRRSTGLDVAVQEEPRGTGDAVRCARAALEGRADDVLVLSGDTPLLTTRAPPRARRDASSRGGGGDRSLVRAGRPQAVRARAARGGRRRWPRSSSTATRRTSSERCARSTRRSTCSGQIGCGRCSTGSTPHNAQGELYLTDSVRDLVADGDRVAVHKGGDPVETEGVNTRVELAAAAAALRDRINEAHMLAGVTIVDPRSDLDRRRGDARARRGRSIRSRSSAARRESPRAPRSGRTPCVVDATIGEDALVGPFCYLRPGTVLEAGAKAGTFVELKNSRIGERHEGAAPLVPRRRRRRGRTRTSPPGTSRPTRSTRVRRNGPTIGRNVRTGVDNTFVAPVSIGDDAWIAAGSVITEDVPPGALAIARAKQVNKEGRGGKRND